MTAVLDPVPLCGRTTGRTAAPSLRSLRPSRAILVSRSLFVVYPINRGDNWEGNNVLGLLSFHHTSFGVTKFVGLAQYRQMCHVPGFWSSVRTTLIHVHT